jgi:surface protein
MYAMFWECNSLTSLDVSNFVVNKATNMTYMFYYCANLETLDISNFVCDDIGDIHHILTGCEKLRILNMTNCDAITINNVMRYLPVKLNKYGKLYILNNKEHDLIDKAALDTINWKAVIYGGNIKAVHIPEGIFNSLGLGNVLLKHIHIGERFL